MILIKGCYLYENTHLPIFVSEDRLSYKHKLYTAIKPSDKILNDMYKPY